MFEATLNTIHMTNPFMPDAEAQALRESRKLKLNYTQLRQYNGQLVELADAGQDFSQDARNIIRETEGITEVIVMFTGLEGELHELPFEKRHFLNSEENLTFDGSSIGGFSTLDQSDLRLKPDWSSFKYAPADVFGPGKVIIIADVLDKDHKPYESDLRGTLKRGCSDLGEVLGMEGNVTFNIAPEIEGFLLEGINSDVNFNGKELTPADVGGYMRTRPGSKLSIFTERLRETLEALGMITEKRHGEVAPGQFEVNLKYANAVRAADQIQLYKYVAKEIAAQYGLTATFLPKVIEGINGSGKHINISVSQNGENRFYDTENHDGLSNLARRSIAGVLYHSPAITAVACSSASSYQRLDPKFEAPNAIQQSSTDRGSIIRIPIGDRNSTRIEARFPDPECNPYMALTLFLRAMVDGVVATGNKSAEMLALLENNENPGKLPGSLSEALDKFEKSELANNAMGPDAHKKYLELKREATRKTGDEKLDIQRSILGHHATRNQLIERNLTVAEEAVISSKKRPVAVA